MSNATMQQDLAPTEVLPLVDRWLDWDKQGETRAEIEMLKDEKNWTELERRLGSNIQFGTAGLRGRMQAGFAYMNCLTVISASQGIAMYMLKTMSHKSPSELSVLIGYDSRHHSFDYAKVVATAFTTKGIKVLLYEDYVPTPFVSFGVNHFKANVGIMVTASHNPKHDNGYKVYWSNGCQINDPVDKEIAASIRTWETPWPEAFRTLTDTYDFNGSGYRGQVIEAYLARLKQVCSDQPTSEQGTAENAAFCYTPMHGVGDFVMEKIAAEVIKQTALVVPEQRNPDPEFPTVDFPNPEEPGALDAALRHAKLHNCHAIIANDPDADRLKTAEMIDDQSWHEFTGDQLGVLLASYLMDKEKRVKSSEQRVALLSSAVSSGMLKKHVTNGGSRFYHEETLTGFKWIGNRAKSLTEQGFKVIFGYEEALGYMLPSVSFDKDGLAAAAVYLEARTYWQSKGLTPYKKLMQIYDEIGYHESINTYFRSPSPAITTAFFEKLREAINDSPALGLLKFEKWRDVTKGHVVGEWDSQLQDSGSQMITCVVVPETAKPQAKVTFTLRGSGTEPKLKLYLEASSPEQGTANAQAAEVLRMIISEWIKRFGDGLTYSPSVATSSGRSVKLE